MLPNILRIYVEVSDTKDMQNNRKILSLLHFLSKRRIGNRKLGKSTRYIVPIFLFLGTKQYKEKNKRSSERKYPLRGAMLCDKRTNDYYFTRIFLPPFIYIPFFNFELLTLTLSFTFTLTFILLPLKS